jgi:hypothetical protein
MVSKIWNEADVFLYTLGAIALNNVHEVLSISALIVSLVYGVLKLKKDFFNNK